MRHPIIVGNWKMNMFISSSIKWVEELLDNNPTYKEKFESYKKMLDDLSNLEILKTSDDFLDKLHKRINESKVVPKHIYANSRQKTIFRYDYVTISGIAAAVGIFMFSISTFMSSDSLPSFDMDKLSAKNIQQKLDDSTTLSNLAAQDDTSSEKQEIDLPKIHLVGGEK